MVEVFKTNVTDRHHAGRLVDLIHRTFIHYRANFDLDDCDRILRVQCAGEKIQSALLIRLLKNSGVHAEVLPDDLPVSSGIIT